ncbi:hypothetical protein HDU97_005848 [Phlyctochytrium planicorne]|nr:hypothetical protein HDU97_005848 [Phlyctochytrium planicorne]
MHLLRPFTVAAAGAAAVAVYLWSKRSSKKAIKNENEEGDQEYADFPVVDGALPVLGHFLKTFSGAQKDFFRAAVGKYGNAFYVFLGNLKLLVLNGAEYHKWSYIKGEDKYISGGWPPRWKTLLGEKSIQVSGGKFHRKLRQLIAKGVSRSTLSVFYPTLRENSRKVLNDLVRLSENGKKVILPIDAARIFTFNAICGFIGCSDAEHVKKFEALREDFITWSQGLNDFFIPEWLPFSPYGKAMAARRRIADVVTKVIIERKERAAKGEVFNDALGIFITARDEDGEEFGIQEIADNFIPLAFAGYDTTSSTICNVLHILLNEIHEDELSALKEEVLALEDPIDESTLNSLPILDAFVKEVLRIAPPAASTFKQTTEDVDLEPGKKLKKGTLLLLPILANHYQEDIYPQPEKFRFSRFLTDEVDKKHPLDYIPFGSGPRLCLGMQLARTEVKMILVEVMRNFNIVKGGETIYEPVPFNIRIPRILISHKTLQ